MHRERVLARGTYREHLRIEKILTQETTGGFVLLAATVLALVLANSPLADAYFGVRDAHLGFDIGDFHLDLSIGHWAADGLLAIFFFLAGLELKMEFVTGDLRSPGKALVPVVAAAGGVAVPAVIFTLINTFGPPGALGGWAIPAATDIAFALAVLALLGSHLPSAVRTFLLTLAIVDDLIAILIIAIFYTSDLRLGYLALSLIPIALYALLAHRAESLFKISYGAAWFLLLPLGVITWALFLNSGVHATIAGVVLAFTVPVRSRSKYGPDYSLAQTFEHRFRPLSSGIAVPVFAFFSAGVAVGGASGLLEAWESTVALGVIVGLVCGKILGIVGSTYLVTRLRHANLDPDIRWMDLVGMAALAGIGFTVSLLVSELSFAPSDPMHDHAKVGVLTASLVAAVLGAVILLPRNRRYREIARRESADADADGVPDVFSAEDPDQRP
ncbi:Na+/H+ antiporter NhaA [Brachybacterium endophyticum]|uniref:Na(+)/H(+) antiporter NhaA n=1 Tax=Brachybacterium endophyticum TaxID=2182385 RepID=A0A2U2RJV6_9MICO|nr:Na+/H+ antiporter NhaA [Brachybacterium endophyticum]PWH06085.1 Na+/H+ antiporter NhaA [Brachybacterium endophyticum]